MRIRLEHNGTVFEYERQPLPESRFRALCAIVVAGIYSCMVTAVTALCGAFGLLLAMGGTVLIALVVKGFE